MVLPTMVPIPVCSKCFTLWQNVFEEREHPGRFFHTAIHQSTEDQSWHLHLQSERNHTEQPLKIELEDCMTTEYATVFYRSFLESKDFTATFKPVEVKASQHKPLPPQRLPSVPEADNDDGSDDDDDNKGPSKQRTSKTAALDLSTLSKHFHLTSQDACKALNISGTTLKKICRQHGLPRWPHRKVKSFQANVHVPSVNRQS